MDGVRMDAFLQALRPAKRLRHCGQYHAALELLAVLEVVSLPPGQAVLVAAEKASVHVAQGYLGCAAEVMRTFIPGNGAEEQLVRVFTALYDIQVQGLVRDARAVAEDALLTPQLDAEISRLVDLSCMRILLLAAVVHDMGAAQAEEARARARARLEAAVDKLIVHKRLEDAFDALLLLVQVLGPDEAQRRLDGFLVLCEQDGDCEHLRALCLLERAEKLQAAARPWEAMAADALAICLQCGNVVGAADARIFQAAHQTGVNIGTVLQQLTDLVNECTALDYPRGQLVALHHICVTAHEHRRYNLYFAAAADQCEIAEKVALHLHVVLCFLQHISGLALTEGHLGKVVEGFDWAMAFLDTSQLVWLKALFLRAYGAAYISRGMRDDAIRLCTASYDLLREYGTVEEISLQATFVGLAYLAVDDIPFEDRGDAYAAAKSRVLEFVAWDEERDLVAGLEAKYAMLIIVNVFLRHITPAGPVEDARLWLHKVIALEARLPPGHPDVKRIRANRLQYQALIALCEGQATASLAHYTNAMQMCDDPGLYLQLLDYLGMSALADLGDYQKRGELFALESAAEKLQLASSPVFALDFPERRVRFYYWRARILEEQYIRRAVPNLAPALDLLDAAYSTQEAIRRELSLLPRAVALHHKVKLSAGERTRSVLGLALRIASANGDLPALRSWLVRAKARSLSDMVGLHLVVPATVIAALDMEGQGMLQELQDLARCAVESPAPSRPYLRRQFAHLHDQMSRHSAWRKYLRLRDGYIDSEAVLESPDHADVLVVDYLVNEDDSIVALTTRAGEPPQMWRIPLTGTDVRRWKAEFLNMTDLEYNGRCLRRLAPLIAPLSQCAAVGQVLALIPSGPLHGIPLHAIPLGGAPLLQRNPVVYNPSIAVMNQCRTRSLDVKTSNAIFLGAAQDRPGALLSASRLAERLNGHAILGESATLSAFAEASRVANLIHFHGHAQFDVSDPQQSHIKLADGALAAQSVLELPFAPCDVTLVACGSGEQYIAPGDEPSGLIPALLVAGATSVVATLWPVRDDDGVAFSSRFYDDFVGGEVVDLARSLQKAALGIRDAKSTSSPFFWASFVLYGSWTRTQAPLGR